MDCPPIFCFLCFTPYFLSYDLPDRGRCNTVPSCQRFATEHQITVDVLASDFFHLPFGQFRSPCPLSFPRLQRVRHQTCCKCVVNVCVVVAPFQIFSPVVLLVSVNMVHFSKVAGVRNECFSNKPMDKEAALSTVFVQVYDRISPFVLSDLPAFIPLYRKNVPVVADLIQPFKAGNVLPDFTHHSSSFLQVPLQLLHGLGRPFFQDTNQFGHDLWFVQPAGNHICNQSTPSAL